jgi:hypothetical protein
MISRVKNLKHKVIPKQPQESVFQLRESCPISSVASALVLEIQMHLRLEK